MDVSHFWRNAAPSMLTLATIFSTQTINTIEFGRKGTLMKEKPVALIVVLLFFACQGPQVEEEKEETREPIDAEARFLELEQSLLRAKNVSMKISITSSGAVHSSLEGNLRLSEPNQAYLDFKGEFDGKRVEIRLDSQGDRMFGGSADKSFEEDTPPALNEGIVLGLTRMGILHNLAMLSAGAPPDGTDGNVRDWVQARDFSYDEASKAIQFEIVVSGTPSGEVELWVDENTGLPKRRKQTVHFPEGDMHVEEVYEMLQSKP